MRAGENKRRICDLFTRGKTLNYEGKEHEILIVGKPTCVDGGEPKTDIFSDWKQIQVYLFQLISHD